MGKHRWKGELAKPIYLGTIPGIEATKGWLKGPDGKRLRADRWTQAVIWNELVWKLDLLREHYKIKSKQDFFSLALCLARDHVPGFRVVPDVPLTFKRGKGWGGVIRAGKGRPLTWSLERVNRLRSDVRRAKTKNQFQTEREAIEHIIQTSQEWRRPVSRSLEQWRKTLQNQLAANPEK
jgi:hypothetical protein